uniref:ATP synthase subunit a n=1 Tax=Polistes jokahamae TaxID=256662 RepID=A0A0F7H217_POLJO|nr:ATP synthase FO subunit 6 [Polistes jokahamae]
MLMMTNLFSIFDPSTSMNLSMNWLSLLIPMIIFPKQFWFKKSKNLMFWMLINNFLLKEFNMFKKNKMFSVMNLLSLFFLILIMNFLGMFPYIFTPSSHLTITLSLSLSLWMSIMIFNWFNFTMKCLAHLVPLNTPIPLMMFMVLIETISTIIRPLTLAIRLSANMIAGHLLLCLLGSCGPLIKLNFLFLVYFTQILLFILEMAVAIIQSYVFMTLMSLYYNEL